MTDRTYTNHITRVEIYSDTKDFAAAVECFDEGAATVEIKSVTNGADWLNLSAAVLAALKAMQLEGDA
jgi:hypothetical protein